MRFKRISKGLFTYGIYDLDKISIDDIISKYGENKDYYESIYTYPERKYLEFISGLDQAVEFLNYTIKDKDPISLFERVWPSIKDASDKGNKKAIDIRKKISVAGTSDIKTDKLVFDLDCENIDNAHKDAQEICHRLSESGVEEETIQLYYSGNKGFHVIVNLENPISRKEFEAVTKYFSNGIESFDHTVKDEQRLLRATMTKHPKSGCYKIPLTVDEFFSSDTETIKKLAKKPKEDRYILKDKFNSYPKIKVPDVNFKEEELLNSLSNEPTEIEIDFVSKPEWLTPEKYALQQGFFEKGERNSALMILCATYKKNGFDKAMSLAMLIEVCKKRYARDPSATFSENEISKTVVDYVYGPNWKGGTYSSSETELLKKIAERFNVVGVDNPIGPFLNIDECFTNLFEFSKNFTKNIIQTGLKTIDDNLILSTGTMASLVGAPGVGKTTFSNLFVKNVVSKNEHVIYHSLDMPSHIMISRMVSHYCNYDFKQICSRIEKNEVDPILYESINKVKEDYKNVHFDFSTGPTVDGIENNLKNIQDTLGINPKLMVVDYLEKVRGPYQDPNANGAIIVSRLADIAKKHNTLLLLLVQPQKATGDIWNELGMRNTKGTSVIEQDSRSVLTAWRPGGRVYDQRQGHDVFIKFCVAKNNFGPRGIYNLGWDGRSGRIFDLNAEQKREVQRIEEEIARREEDNVIDSYKRGFKKRSE